MSYRDPYTTESYLSGLSISNNTVHHPSTASQPDTTAPSTARPFNLYGAFGETQLHTKADILSLSSATPSVPTKSSTPFLHEAAYGQQMAFQPESSSSAPYTAPYQHVNPADLRLSPQHATTVHEAQTNIVTNTPNQQHNTPARGMSRLVIAEGERPGQRSSPYDKGKERPRSKSMVEQSGSGNRKATPNSSGRRNRERRVTGDAVPISLPVFLPQLQQQEPSSAYEPPESMSSQAANISSLHHAIARFYRASRSTQHSHEEAYNQIMDIVLKASAASRRVWDGEWIGPSVDQSTDQAVGWGGIADLASPPPKFTSQAPTLPSSLDMTSRGGQSSSIQHPAPLETIWQDDPAATPHLSTSTISQSAIPPKQHGRSVSLPVPQATHQQVFQPMLSNIPVDSGPQYSQNAVLPRPPVQSTPPTAHIDAQLASNIKIAGDAAYANVCKSASSLPANTQERINTAGLEAANIMLEDFHPVYRDAVLRWTELGCAEDVASERGKYEVDVHGAGAVPSTVYPTPGLSSGPSSIPLPNVSGSTAALSFKLPNNDAHRYMTAFLIDNVIQRFNIGNYIPIGFLPPFMMTGTPVNSLEEALDPKLGWFWSEEDVLRVTEVLAREAFGTKNLDGLLMHYLSDVVGSPHDEAAAGRVSSLHPQNRVELGSLAVNCWMDELLGMYREKSVEKIGTMDDWNERERYMLEARRKIVDSVSRELVLNRKVD
ncbi:hypothetical protein L198_01307 [Cryptococcus wingfieldii CBS 7118]|uniref:Uncharacterized protein n=1 Tax=Cryptococcus wingfieldii CBS 7118 TaxID=1295528 RepID=A0A1E3JYX8_9TREE|nr:hypothetical protein L198_01307 [Cryptococcus wingfieldii CBS 7118]ODO06078.1 hypothetical protein L198_01307 [Cryptococcus wingfieldii CBS 7118]